MKRLVIVANSSYAELFELNAKELKKIELVDYPNGRLKGIEILSDRPGRGFESTGSGIRHALNPELDVHTREQQIFAHQIIDLLKKSQLEGKFEGVILIAPPEFLGILRPALPNELKKKILKEFKKDLPEALSDNERSEQIFRLLNIKKNESPSPWTKEAQRVQ